MPDIQHEDLISFVEKMPAFPRSVCRIVKLTSNINVSAQEIIQVIESDPVMTFKILKAINSGFYGLPKKTSSIQYATIHIGLNTIKNLALNIASMGVLNPNNKARFNTDDYLLHSLTTASICRLLAERLNIAQDECSDFYIAGLLHDFGEIVFAEFYPENFKLALEKSTAKNIPLHVTELEFIGMTHSQVVQLLASEWGLAESLVNAINHHHNDDDQDNILNDCVFVANQISTKLHFGFIGDPIVEELPLHIQKRFGLSLDELIHSLGDLSILKTKALAFINGSVSSI
ncbi:MAG: HDOD domain-containing protein [Methylococcales bacterium]|nr:HDOD domain-containing protein [Methylococcales bacterium]